MRLEVWFTQQDEASVFLESSLTDPDEEQFYETTLFTLYAARQIANLGSEGVSLALVLQTTDTSNPLEQAAERLGNVRVTTPRSSSGGRKGFTAEFRPDKRAFFKLNQHGFGMLGRGVAYYAPTSTLALLYWLLSRREDNAVYQRAVSAAAENIGILGMRGEITVTTQADAAMSAAAAAWQEAGELGGVDADDLSEGARKACADHAINFPSLVSDAYGRLYDAVSQLEGESGVMAIHHDYQLRTCRIEVLLAAGFDEELDRPFAAVEAAEASGDEATIEAAEAHFRRTLAQLAEQHNLEPVVEALRNEIFTSDPHKAAEF